MYKAVNSRDKTEVVILDPQWLSKIEHLRALAREDILVCQGCQTPVRVRAGSEKRPHFAHKHLLNCTYTDESAILRNTRAVLYEWLVGKFGTGVTIEKKVDDLFRPVDCWAEQDSRIYAYWILDTRLPPEKREILKDIFKQLNVEVNWIFTHDMLRRDSLRENCILLSTTEREFRHRSDYDAVVKMPSGRGRTLHYLDAENRKLVTFRGLDCAHEPEVYRGEEAISDLKDVQVRPSNGELVHPGEYQRLQAYLQRKEEEEGAKAPRRKLTVPKPYMRLLPETEPQLYTAKPSSPQPTEKAINDQEEAVCIYCGETTTDWWMIDRSVGTCKCRKCRDKNRQK